MSLRTPRPHRPTSRPASPLQRATASVIESLESRRLLSAGAVDQDYNFVLGLGNPSAEIVTAVAKSGDKVVVAGVQASTNNVLLARFNANGTLDTSFDGDGKAVLSLGAGARFDALTVDASGNILAAGVKGDDGFVAKVNSAGALQFSTVVDFANGVDSLSAIAADPSGAIVVAGKTGAPGATAIAVAKLTAAGGFDTSFSADGKATTAVGDAAAATAVLLSGDGEVFVGGSSTTGPAQSFAVVKYTSQGLQDLTFSGDGIAVTGFGPTNAEIRSLAFNGARLLAIGGAGGVALAQYDAGSGALDTGFDFDGVAHFPGLAGLTPSGGGVADGMIYVTGNAIDPANPSVVRAGALRFTPGDLVDAVAQDLAYGVGGVAVSGVTLNTHPSFGTFHVTAVGADGTIAAAATFADPQSGFDLTAGTISAAGAAGPVGTAGFYAASADTADAIYVYPNGDTLVLGNRAGASNAVLIRRLANGDLDTTFNFTGIVQVNLGGAGDVAQSIAVDSAGNIVVAGLQSGTTAVARRYSSTGASVAGILTVPGDAEGNVSVAIDASDRIVLAGTTIDAGFARDIFIARFLPNGSLDPSLNSTGLVVLAPGGLTDEYANALLIVDGDIVVGGSTSDASDQDSLLVRVDDLGNPLSTFVVDLGDYDAINDLAVAADGTTIYAAASTDPNGNTVTVARFPAVGVNTSVNVAGLPPTSGGASAIAIDHEGKFLLSTNFGVPGSLEMGVIRLNADLSPDLTFNAGSASATVSFGPGQDTAAAIGVDDDGNVYVAGSTTITPGDTDLAVARLIGYEAANLPPTLQPIAPVTAPESSLITFPAVGADPDNNLPLAYSLIGAPAGASIDPVSGVFTWTPAENQDGNYTFTVRVTDALGAFADQSVTITATEVNVSPTLAPIPNASVTVGATVTFTAAGSDTDLVAGASQTLTYTLTGTVPAGASIDPVTGLFTWTPTAGQTGAHTFAVRVSDGALTAAQSVTITVNSVPPAGPTVTFVGGVLTITGTTGANSIIVNPAAGGVSIVLDGQPAQTLLGALASIVINAGAGNDTITVSNAITAPATVTGGEGNDVINGGGGNDMLYGDDGIDGLFGSSGNDGLFGGLGADLLYGDTGHDIVLGGAGADAIVGGSGRDLLIGGLGGDLIVGDNDDDVMVAGYTVHDADFAALSNIRNVWLSGASYANRVNTLRTTLLRPDLDVFDDQVVDYLVGSAGLDWFVVNSNSTPSSRDVILDRAPSERITDVDPA